jgi:hypothetical protein
VLRKPHDLGARARLELGQRLQLEILRLLEVRVHGPAVRAAVGVAELLCDPLDHVLRERVPEQVGLLVRLGGGVAQEVGEEALDDSVAADDAFGDLPSLPRQDRLPVLAALDESLALEPLEHLAGGGPGDSEHVRDSYGQGR